MISPELRELEEGEEEEGMRRRAAK